MSTPSASDINVRSLIPTDAGRVRELFLAGMRSMMPLLPNETAHIEAEEYFKSVLTTDLADPHQHYMASQTKSAFWVAETAGEVVGSVGVYPLASELDVAEVFRVSVDGQYRKLGIAGRLMDEAETWSSDQGYKQMMLHTTEYLHAAHRLYESRGYELARRLQFGQIQGREYRKLLV